MANQINVTYNGNSLQNANIITGDIQHTAIPTKKVSSNARARTPGVIVSATQQLEKVIVISGKIVGSSLTDLDARIDALKTVLAVDGMNLDIDWNGGSRRYVATVNAVALKGRADSPFAEKFTISFLVPDGYGISTSASVLVAATTITASPTTPAAFTVGGTSPMQFPTFALTVTSFTGSTTNTIAITNPANGMKIYIIRTWTAGDVIAIDTNPNTFTVTVNGVAVDYAGSFPFWAPGAGATVTVSDDFTARSISFAMSNVNRWS